MTGKQKKLTNGMFVITLGFCAIAAFSSLRLRNENQALQDRQDPLRQQIEQLQRECAGAANALAVLAGENAVLKNNPAEVAKLRGEVPPLQQESQELADLKARASATGSYNPSQTNKFMQWLHDEQTRESRTELEGMKYNVGLSPLQEQAIRDLQQQRSDVNVQSAYQRLNGGQTPEQKAQASQAVSNLNARIAAQLSPDQQPAYQTFEQRGAEAWAHVQADGELFHMQNFVGLSQNQNDAVYQVLYNFALKQKHDGEADPTQKAEALAKILTPSQMEVYRTYLQGKNIRTMVQLQ